MSCLLTTVIVWVLCWLLCVSLFELCADSCVTVWVVCWPLHVSLSYLLTTLCHCMFTCWPLCVTVYVVSLYMLLADHCVCHCLSCLLIGLCVTVSVAWWWVVCWQLCVSLYRLLTDCCMPPYELLADYHVCHCINCLLTAMCHCMHCLLMAVCVTV